MNFTILTVLWLIPSIKPQKLLLLLHLISPPKLLHSLQRTIVSTFLQPFPASNYSKPPLHLCLLLLNVQLSAVPTNSKRSVHQSAALVQHSILKVSPS